MTLIRDFKCLIIKVYLLYKSLYGNYEVATFSRTMIISRVCYVPGTQVFCILYESSHLTLTIIQSGYNYYHHFIDEQTAWQRGYLVSKQQSKDSQTALLDCIVYIFNHYPVSIKDVLWVMTSIRYFLHTVLIWSYSTLRIMKLRVGKEFAQWRTTKWQSWHSNPSSSTCSLFEKRKKKFSEQICAYTVQHGFNWSFNKHLLRIY